MIQPADLPDYLVDVVAREVFERDHGGTRWEDADEMTRKSCEEVARMILVARVTQSAIKR